MCDLAWACLGVEYEQRPPDWDSEGSMHSLPMPLQQMSSNKSVDVKAPGNAA